MNDQLIVINNETLSEFKPVVLRKRLKIEIEYMYPYYNQIIVGTTELNQLKITVIEYDSSNKRQRYDFIIHEGYPFNSPEVFFQNRYYRDFLRMSIYTTKELARFKKITGQDCLCCYSLTCLENWRPSAKLTNIIQEIRKNRKMKRDVLNSLFADKIKRRYLIEDIDLESWLF